MNKHRFQIEGIVGNGNNIYSTFELDRLQHDLAELAEQCVEN